MRWRWLNRLRPSWLPLVIGASVLVIPWFYLMWNTTAGELFPAIRFRTKATIAGIVHAGAPTLSLHAVLTGTYQHWLSYSVGELSPIFKPAVYAKNQLYFTVLGAAGSDNLVIGEHRQLFEKSYLDEYCSRDLTTLKTTGEEWAGRIRHMQDVFAAHGTAFLYIITPSKAAQEPDYMPPRYACPAGIDDRVHKLDVYDAILARHGVHFVDAASELPAARASYGIDMFPQGGLHWNSLGAALGAQKVIAAANAQHPAALLTSFDFTWKVSHDPRGIDRDLIDIMNLPHPDLHYAVSELAYRSKPPPGECRTAKIAEVGGSFLGGINDPIARTACPPIITFWSYWDRAAVRYLDGRWYTQPLDADARLVSLLDADMVFLEENESLGPGSLHGRSMMQEIEAMSGNRSAARE
jgi:hypothetical protein